jgi:pyruvate ferredoxin oxidoreductase alpha subunit
MPAPVPQERKALTGGESAAFVIKQIEPEVYPAYPITPSSTILELFARYVANGEVSTTLINVESEHSALSAVMGAQAAGVRAMTSTSGNGLALMFEIVYITAGMRLPVVMNIGNRAIAGPINIHSDHSDAMACRDSGWMQFFAENCQEVYDFNQIAMKVAEHRDVLLPAMVCQDGFYTTHNLQEVFTHDEKYTKGFIGEYTPKYPLLNVNNPVAIGGFDLNNYYFEHKRQQFEGMENAKWVIKEIFRQYGDMTGRYYEPVEKYRTEDAEFIIILLSSTAGAAKLIADELREQGIKAGVVRPRVFRPWFHMDVVESIKNAKAVAVMDKTVAFGALGGPLFNEVRSALADTPHAPHVINYIFGLGGREVKLNDIRKVYSELMDLSKTHDMTWKVRFLGVRE